MAKNPRRPGFFLEIRPQGSYHFMDILIYGYKISIMALWPAVTLKKVAGHKNQNLFSSRVSTLNRVPAN